MAGKLPIDRMRARTVPAQPYEEHKQAFTQDQVHRDNEPDRDHQPDKPIESPEPVSGERGEERDDA